MVAKKKMVLDKASEKALKETDFRGVIAQFVKVLMLLGADKEDIIDAVQAAKPPAALSRSVKIVSGTLAHWALLMRRWADDPKFLNSEGRPKDLPFSGKEASFSKLVESELPGENPALARDMLLSATSIVRLPSGKLRWRNRDVQFRQKSPSSKRGMAETIFVDEFLNPIKALLSCSEINLTRPIRHPGAFHSTVSGFALAPKDIEEFRFVLDRHGLAFLETLDDWLAHRARNSTANKNSNLVSPLVGLFMATEETLSPLSGTTAKPKRRSRAAKLRR